ncbi:MAG: hypothetical protein Ct9H90mP22_8600 [Gammaproteobacteria bacterium]|nr:MAG: hypothetical protein Ct9H90mP22_8600 [Gammaproteobacteria bacterium]
MGKRFLLLEQPLLEQKKLFIEEKGYKDFTDLFIYPGFKFKGSRHAKTNFHLPKSLYNVSFAFIGF